MTGDMEQLFSHRDLSDVLEDRQRRMYAEIDNIDGNRLLNTSVDDLCDYFVSEYTVQTPELQEGNISMDQGEADVDLRRNPNYHVPDQSRPALVKGTGITIFIPFNGDAGLFKYHPSQYTMAPPHAEVREGELVIAYKGVDLKADSIKKNLNHKRGEIHEWLSWIANDVKPFNESMRNRAKQRIEARRQKLLKDQGLGVDLGFPLRRRNDAPKTYVAPEVRRKPQIKMPEATTAPYVAGPVLEMKEYEHILSVISGMVSVIERSPDEFRTIKEETLRHHFLIQLNGQYGGKATGETFNAHGKTDILLRNGDKNIFIAECKFWDGPKSLTGAINQLLGYTSWRDTKTALLIFNRDRDFSTVLSKIPATVKEHGNFKREEEYNSESGFRYILHHNDDKHRELILTILAFEVPTCPRAATESV